MHQFGTLNEASGTQFRHRYAIADNLGFETPVDKVIRRIHVDIRVPAVRAVLANHIPPAAVVKEAGRMSLYGVTVGVEPHTTIADCCPAVSQTVGCRHEDGNENCYI